MVCVCVLHVCKRSEGRRQACCDCVLGRSWVQPWVSALTFCLLSQSLIVWGCVVSFKVAGSWEVVWGRNGFSCVDFHLTGHYRCAPPLLNFFKHRFWGSKHQACVTSAFTCLAIMPAPNIVAFLYCSTCVGGTHMYAHCVCVKNIGQFVGVVSLFPTWRSLGLNSGRQTLQPVPSPAEHILLAPQHRLK